ncbi:hypothetical protein BU15DRAFT_67025 [Melanogaster broomeanus]|nr:hypothetical protein BU15DRAFT_67025 [Melanogaster broomeanus]
MQSRERAYANYPFVEIFSIPLKIRGWPQRSQSRPTNIVLPCLPSAGVNLPDNWRNIYPGWLVKLRYVVNGNFSAQHMKMKIPEDDVPLSEMTMNMLRGEDLKEVVPPKEVPIWMPSPLKAGQGNELGLGHVLAFAVYKINWLKAKARYCRWKDELELVRHEMYWVVKWFQGQELEWKRRARESVEGLKAYAERKVLPKGLTGLQRLTVPPVYISVEAAVKLDHQPRHTPTDLISPMLPSTYNNIPFPLGQHLQNISQILPISSCTPAYDLEIVIQKTHPHAASKKLVHATFEEKKQLEVMGALAMMQFLWTLRPLVPTQPMHADNKIASAVVRDPVGDVAAMALGAQPGKLTMYLTLNRGCPEKADEDNAVEFLRVLCTTFCLFLDSMDIAFHQQLL